MKFNKENIFSFLTFILCCFIAIIFALINKFSLVYSDTGTYIVSGFEFELPFDRPIFYGLFLRLTSLGLSLWITILVQAMISVFLVRELLIYLTGRGKSINIMMLILMLLLSFFSAFSFVVSIVIADIFTAYIILCILL